MLTMTRMMIRISEVFGHCYWAANFSVSILFVEVAGRGPNTLTCNTLSINSSTTGSSFCCVFTCGRLEQV